MRENLKLGPRYDGFLFLAESARNPPRLNSHHHIELELNLVVRGSITYVAGGARNTFGRRTLLWMFPAQEHQLVDRSNDAQYFVVVFKPELIARSCRSKGYAELHRKRSPTDGVLHCVLKPPEFDLVQHIMNEMMIESIDADVLNREAGFGVGSDFSFSHGDPDGLNSGLHYLLLLCWRLQRSAGVPNPSVEVHPSVRQALRMLGDDESNHSLKQLAHACGVSPAYLSRAFSQQVGVPFNRYRNSVRLARFWKSFRRADKPTLSEAAFQAGFGSYAQFYKIFSEAYGEGPRECLRSSSKH